MSQPNIQLSILPLNSARDLVLQFDSEVRDTTAAIHHVRAYNGISGASIYTFGAGAAMIGSGLYIVFQLDIYDQLRQKKEGAHLLAQQV
jgi:hypothetical protein